LYSPIVPFSVAIVGVLDASKGVEREAVTSEGLDNCTGSTGEEGWKIKGLEVDDVVGGL